MSKGVSEYKMSYALGHSRGYINNISSGKSLPPMSEFLAICEYFGITPKEFFDDGVKYPELISKAVDRPPCQGKLKDNCIFNRRIAY